MLMMKTCHPSIKQSAQQRGKKGTKWQVLTNKKILQRGQIARGTKKIKYLNPPNHKKDIK
jgi:hypothetical protein